MMVVQVVFQELIKLRKRIQEKGNNNWWVCSFQVYYYSCLTCTFSEKKVQMGHDAHSDCYGHRDNYMVGASHNDACSVRCNFCSWIVICF